jgi:hypothetical protein
MATMHPCEKVGVEFVDTAPYRFSNSVDLNITPEQVFEVMADASSWPRWAKVITKVTWTSPPPYGPGTTRTVDMLGGLVATEEFLLWEEHSRIAFRFNEASEKTIRAFAERYDILRTDTGCRLTWNLSLDVDGAARRTMPIAKPINNLAFKWFLWNLRRYTDKVYGASAGRSAK